VAVIATRGSLPFTRAALLSIADLGRDMTTSQQQAGTRRGPVLYEDHEAIHFTAVDAGACFHTIDLAFA